VWVFFGTSIILFTPSELLQHIHIDNLPELILVPIGLLFIGSFSLLIVDIGILLKNKIHRAHRKRLSKITISQIEVLINEFGDGYNSQDECLKWAYKVLPIIEFDDECYGQFKSDLNSIQNLGFRKEILSSLQKKLKQYLLQLVEQLKK